MSSLPPEYVAQKFLQYVPHAKYSKVNGTYHGSCISCNDYKGKKRRLYYIPKKDLIYCFNCNISCRPLKWLLEITNQTKEEILEESQSYDILPPDFFRITTEVQKVKVPSLPHDCINLFDSSQLEYFKDNKVVQDALQLIKNRLIDVAVNKPKTLWLSLTDEVHNSRLVIPFYDISGSITYYQSRALYNNSETIKYLSKTHGDRTLYNINKISSQLEYIFVTEGPIDAFFLQNGTCTCGITEKGEQMFTAIQQRQLDPFKFHQIIWCLDSQYLDKTSLLKTKKLVDQDQKVFIWPEEIGRQYKDINEYCIAKQLKEFDYKIILENTFTGLAAKLKLAAITCR